ncbi:hypothetical protein J5500_03965 [Candidatus Saccharibacteria bacterium]|nr:hypothetical protein [Candidatus Saccharibacteria bacterium]
MLLLLSLILARPVFMGAQAQSEYNNLNFFFVVDATNSMSAADVEGEPRYVKVAKDIKALVEKYPGSRYSLIIEDSVVYTAVPMSTNADFIENVWGSSKDNGTATASKGLVAPKSVSSSNGSDLKSLIDYSQKQVQSYAKKYATRKNLYFFMSDGENTQGSTITGLTSLRNSIQGGAIFGYGSTNGAVVSETGNNSSSCVKYFGSKGTIEVDNKNCVLSKINESILQDMAKDLSLQYYHRTSGDIPSEVTSSIDKIMSYTASDESADSYGDTYWFFSMILIVLLLWDFREVMDSVMREREFKHA